MAAAAHPHGDKHDHGPRDEYPMRLKVEMLKEACNEDRETFCPDRVDWRDEAPDVLNTMACLKEHEAELSRPCYHGLQFIAAPLFNCAQDLQQTCPQFQPPGHFSPSPEPAPSPEPPVDPTVDPTVVPGPSGGGSSGSGGAGPGGSGGSSSGSGGSASTSTGGAKRRLLKSHDWREGHPDRGEGYPDRGQGYPDRDDREKCAEERAARVDCLRASLASFSAQCKAAIGDALHLDQDTVDGEVADRAEPLLYPEEIYRPHHGHGRRHGPVHPVLAGVMFLFMLMCCCCVARRCYRRLTAHRRNQRASPGTEGALHPHGEGLYTPVAAPTANAYPVAQPMAQPVSNAMAAVPVQQPFASAVAVFPAQSHQQQGPVIHLPPRAQVYQGTSGTITTAASMVGAPPVSTSGAIN